MDIRINRLTLDNFKGHKHLNIQFNGQNTTIYGNNATGKTSVYDALIWLLFGKDSSGVKDFSIKPVDSSGAVLDHNAITCVEAELMVDGRITIFKRTLQEVWTTRRGSTQQVYTGNTSNYFVDGVPCKLNVYESKIKELVPEDIFRLLTSVGYFPATMKWQDRRATLFDMAKTMTDTEIMAQDIKFTPLMEGMGSLALDDYKKKLLAEKKGFTGIQDHTPSRLDECNKVVAALHGIDFAALRAGLATLEASHQSVLSQLSALDNDTAAANKQLEIRECEAALRVLEGENVNFRASQTTGNLNTAPLQRNLEDRKRDLATVQAQIRSAENSLPGYDASIEASRERWVKVKSEIYTGGICPTCGQALPADQVAEAQENFERQKQYRLDEIQRTAETQKQAKAQQEANIVSMKDREATIRAEIERLEKQLSAAEAAKVNPVDMPDYAARKSDLNTQITALNAELSVIRNNSAQARQQLVTQKTALEIQMRQQRDDIAKEGVLDFNKKRIEELQGEAKTAAEALEAIEGMLFLMEEFTRFKAKFVEDSINSYFRLATFRLFREQANGGVEDRCDVVYNGVPYADVNNGMKINVGIDIINALSRHYGVTVPLFVDNAESVTQLEPCNAQVIRLVVSESDKELRIINET